MYIINYTIIKLPWNNICINRISGIEKVSICKFLFFIFDMRVLYKQLHPLSNVFAPIRAKNAREFRGAARGVFVSSIILCNCTKLSHICDPVARPS